MNAALETRVTPVMADATFAAAMQSTLVPPLCYRGEFIEAQGQCIPKDQVGGDLMDLVAEAIAYVADVSGHGLRAAKWNRMLAGLAAGLADD